MERQKSANVEDLAEPPVRSRHDRTRSPSAEAPSVEAMTGASGPQDPDATVATSTETSVSQPSAADLEGQLGPDEISEPEEVVKNNEVKSHP